jgi:large subunit ribosomal protein L32
MAQPKKKTTHSRTRMGKVKEKLALPNLVECPNCHELIRPHHVCPHCGYYDGEQKIVTAKKKEKKKES